MLTGLFTTESEEETEALARRLAGCLRAGDVLALRGGLGAGKTAFVRGLVAGLGIDADVSSPTFALVHEYRGSGIPLYHFDLYRITGGEEDLISTGYYDYLEADGILAVEWSERIPEALPPDHIAVTFTVTAPERREVRIEKGGAPA